MPPDTPTGDPPWVVRILNPRLQYPVPDLGFEIITSTNDFTAKTKPLSVTN